ncbi:MAG: thioredoxin family protein [Spirosomataceae bacterium]
MRTTLVLVISCLLFISGCKRNTTPPFIPEETREHTDIQEETPGATAINGVESNGIYFPMTSLKKGLEIAKATDKFVFIDCYTSWCGPCKLMKKYTFTDPVLGSFMNQNFICVAMDMEDDEGMATAKRYGVQAYPTLLFLDKYGRVVNHQVGGIGANELLTKARQVVRK